MTRLRKIIFSDDSENYAKLYGYEETDISSNKLLHLYDENGEQLDNGNGFFPKANWEGLPHTSIVEDSDDFWEAIESMRYLN